MGAASGIMVAKEDAVFPDSGAYGGWPTSSVELCLEKYLSLREHKDVDMDGTIRVIFTKDRFVDDANAPPFGLVVEPFLSGVARIATEGKMDRQSVRRASSALQDGEMLMVRHVEAGSPASDAKVEADWLLSTVCGKIPKSALMVRDAIAAAVAAGDDCELHFTAGPFNHGGAPPIRIGRPLWIHVFNDPRSTAPTAPCSSCR
ncbi:hypothetical protein JL720_6767 [Aureococcus anophagefferens]|nr:hypothetical protein JL720_6767 [Aureococcus anophagefferens]